MQLQTPALSIQQKLTLNHILPEAILKMEPYG